jgi:hypothetical protein
VILNQTYAAFFPLKTGGVVREFWPKSRRTEVLRRFSTFF